MLLAVFCPVAGVRDLLNAGIGGTSYLRLLFVALVRLSVLACRLIALCCLGVWAGGIVGPLASESSSESLLWFGCPRGEILGLISLLILMLSLHVQGSVVRVYPVNPSPPGERHMPCLTGQCQLSTAPSPLLDSGVPGLRRPGHLIHGLPGRGPRDTYCPCLSFRTTSRSAAVVLDRFQHIVPARQLLTVCSYSYIFSW